MTEKLQTDKDSAGSNHGLSKVLHQQLPTGTQKKHTQL
jgi:hypothetical protein